MSNQVEIINQLIKERRSIFPPSYTDQPIADKEIQQILENANYAPTHKLTQPWRFTVFKGAGLIKLADFMGEIYKAATPIEAFSQTKYDITRNKIIQSGAVISIQVKYHSHLLPEWEELAATATAVQNMWLTASAYGIGAYWSTPTNALQPLTTWLNLHEDEKCIGLFYMGYHANAAIPPARRSSVESKTTWITE